jgi:hypothetical protein
VILNIADPSSDTFCVSFHTFSSRSIGFASTLSILIAEGIVDGSIITVVGSWSDTV